MKPRARRLGDSPQSGFSAPRHGGAEDEAQLRPGELHDSPRPVLGAERDRISWTDRLMWIYTGLVISVMIMTAAVVAFDADARQAIVLALIAAVVAPFCSVALGHFRQNRRSKKQR